MFYCLIKLKYLTLNISQVIAGTIDHNYYDQTGSRLNQIVEVYTHEMYKQTNETFYDISVAKLEEAYELSKYIGIITLYEQGYQPKGNMRPRVNSINAHKNIFMNLHKYESRLMS